MKIGFTTGYYEEFWAGWPWSRQYGGSEHLVVEVACELAAQGHRVTVRVPRKLPEERVWRGVRWIGANWESQAYDILFSSDDYAPQDKGESRVLVVQRWAPVQHTRFDEVTFMSSYHATQLGFPSATVIGGGVRIADYALKVARRPRGVLYASSPDRGGHHAAAIGKMFDFHATYRGADEVTRDELILEQKAAKVLIHPCDPAVPSEAFSMAVLEAMAAGTPCVISDADALPELWADAAVILPRPIRYSEWATTIEDLLSSRERWMGCHYLGLDKAALYDWPVVASRYLALAAGKGERRGASLLR